MVPTTIPVTVSRSAAGARLCAMPKSARRARPSLSIRMFDGLTSRCTIPCLWAKKSASATSAPMLAASLGSSAPSRARRASSDSPSMSSITRAGASPSGSTE